MYILPVIVLACAAQAGQPQGLPNYPSTHKYNLESLNIVPNGDFSEGNTGFMSGIPYVAPGKDCLWGHDYTIAGAFNNPQLHTLIAPRDFSAPVEPGAKRSRSQVYFANIGGTGSQVVWTTLVQCRPNTNYLISFQATSLSGSAWEGDHEIPSADWVPDFQMIVNGDKGTPQPAGCGAYSKIGMAWNSGQASSATLSIVRMPMQHWGGLIGITNIRMVTAQEMPRD